MIPVDVICLPPRFSSVLLGHRTSSRQWSCCVSKAPGCLLAPGAFHMHLINTSTVVHLEWPPGGDISVFSDDVFESVAKNRLTVLEAGLAIEGVIARIIGDFFIPARVTPEEIKGDHFKRELFQLLILESDSCSFAAKLKILLTLLRVFEILESKNLKAFETAIRKVMTHRNAFAHGHVKYMLDDPIPLLCFFKDMPKREPLSDDFLKRIEDDLDHGFEQVRNIEKMMSDKGLLPAD